MRQLSDGRVQPKLQCISPKDDRHAVVNGGHEPVWTAGDDCVRGDPLVLRWVTPEGVEPSQCEGSTIGSVDVQGHFPGRGLLPFVEA